ncbi:hypothetical protein H072_2486 [Dactylellina haptotyla CBS 200.50]|uniref:Zn(2)-C6 fungal-type domain-containing protein n=1 Tax=Dactylellina haptotyla (strain CBS 200.50) TaxID=1284197 RepID=S8C746_DACHA|nr:hypothetical protein H072_2486 [Dactylellina haptotyla CBS 200.50]
MSISQILNGRGYSDMPPPDLVSPSPSSSIMSQQPQPQPQQQQQQQPAPAPAPAPAAASSASPATASPSRPQGPAKQIHRNRAQHICHSCRRRKVKCDRQHPVCGGCAKMGVPCEWSDNSQIAKDAGPGASSASDRRPSLSQQSPPTNGSIGGGGGGAGAGGIMPPPPFNPNQAHGQKRGHKRQRTHPDATISEESDSFSDDQRFDVARHSFGRDYLPYWPGGIGRSNSTESTPNNTNRLEDQLENRLGRLAEIVDKWCRETYLGSGAPAPGSFNHDSLLKDLKDLQAFTKRRGSTSHDPSSIITPGSSVPPPWENSQSDYSSHRQEIQLPGGLRSPSTSAMDTSESITYTEDLPMSPFSDPPQPPPPQPNDHFDNSLHIPGAPTIPQNWQTFRSKGMEDLASIFDHQAATSNGQQQQGQNGDEKLDYVIDPRIRDVPTTPKARRGKKGPQGVLVPGKAADDDDLSLGHLSIQEDGRTRYVGSTFWAFISNEISELNQVLQSQNEDAPENQAGCGEGSPKTCNLMEDENKCDGNHPPDQRQTNGHASGLQHITSPPGSHASSKTSPIEPIPNPAHEMARVMAAMDEGNEHDHNFPTNPKKDMGILKILPENSTMCTAAKLQAGFAPEHQARQMVWFLKYLPLEHQSHALYKAFLNGVHPVVPLLHAPSFNKDYTKFWKLKEMETTDNLTFSPTFIPLLFAVLYTGALSISNRKFNDAFPDKEHTRNIIISHLNRAAMAALAVTAFPRGPTLSSLIAYLLIHTCKIREEEPLTSYAFVGVAMRAAQSAGLHREPNSFKGLNEVEREVRRRVWWHIIYLDVQAAIATGLPPLGGSDESAFDTEMVSELKDEYIGAPSPVTAEDIKKDEAAAMNTCTGLPDGLLNTRSSSAMIAAVGRYEATRVLRRLVSSLFSVKVPQKQDVSAMGKIICDLQAKIDERINRIPARGIPEMGFVPPGAPDEENSTEAEKLENFNGWARTMLSLMYDKCFSVLYQPFLRTILSRQWQNARHCSLHACHRLLRKFLFLSNSPAFRPYFWFLPGTYQPLHSCMILLLDLYNSPTSEESRPSRKLLDEVFELFGPDGNGNPNSTSGAYDALAQRQLVEGGKEAWAMMARFRAKAYARGGGEVPYAPPVTQIPEPTDSFTAKPEVRKAPPPSAGRVRGQGLTEKDIDEMIERSIRKPGQKNTANPQMIINALSPPERGGSIAVSDATSAAASDTGIGSGGGVSLPNNLATAQERPRSQNLDYSVVDDLPIFSEMNGATATGHGFPHNLPDQSYANQDFRGGGFSFSPNDFMSYDNGYTIGGVSLDASGYPVIMAPGVMYNMETGQAQVQYEDHGANMDSQSSNGSSGNNNDMFMDMSRDNIDWNAWDKTFGTYASVSQGSDPALTQALHASLHIPPDNFSKENNFA